MNSLRHDLPPFLGVGVYALIFKGIYLFFITDFQE